jgi:hypothetical protein
MKDLIEFMYVGIDRLEKLSTRYLGDESPTDGSEHT